MTDLADTTFALSQAGPGVFEVREDGIVRRSGTARVIGQDLVFELRNDEGAVGARFSCHAIEPCRQWRCAWSVGGAGENLLTK